MSHSLMLSHLARALPRVTASRLRKGPARPSWSFGFELVTSALRTMSLEIAGRSFVEQRKAFDGLTNLRSPVLKRVIRTREMIAGVPCEWFVPIDHVEPAPTIFFLHGGAYIFGSTHSHAELIARIALASKARVLAPNYRLAPEHPFPAGLDDAEALYLTLLAMGVAPSQVVLGGDSAGGGLTTALLLRLRDGGDPLPAGAFLACPWVDLTATGGSLADNEAFDWGTARIAAAWSAHYVKNHDPTNPLISPALAPNLAGLPPLLIQVGAAELMLDQVSTLARRAKEQGTDVRFVVEADMVHDWHAFAGIFHACNRPIDEIGAFVREVTAPPKLAGADAEAGAAHEVA